MSILNNPHNFIVNESGFTSIQNNISSGPTGIELLLEASTPEAAVDAEARQYAPTCYPGTREQHIDDITNWATGLWDEHSPSIYWMRGPAGVGKSAVAQTCAQNVKDADQLGAAFFFSVGARDQSRVFTTIAYQLSTIFSSYRKVLNDKVQSDITILRKTLASQFQSLIVEPLQNLRLQGRGIGRRVIFIDGLDECSNKDAQCEIIDIIASSVKEKSTPFRWAIFSRPEPHIIATFAKVTIVPLCRSVWLPISREIDGEIELYLRGGFDNILRRRNLSLSSPWPTEDVIKMLVNASAGLFAYPAAVLRFIDRYPSLRLEEPLGQVVSIISGEKRHSASDPLAELNAFYVLVMKHIPEHILPSIQLLLADLVSNPGLSWYGALVCNRLGLSEMEFRGICNHLQAVMFLTEPPKPLLIDATIDTTRSFYDQKLSTTQNPIHYNRPHAVEGSIWFHHKTFYDFLVDPDRSLGFCPITPVVRERLFERYIKTQQEYASSFEIRGSRLVLGQNYPHSSTSLSWPLKNEYIDSFVKMWVFTTTSVDLSHNGLTLVNFLEQVSSASLRKLAHLDYRKYLIAELEVTGEGAWLGHNILGARGKARVIPGTMLGLLESDDFKAFDSVTFLQVVKKLEKLGIIRPYHPKLPLSLASIHRSLSRHSRQRESTCGQYKLGYGDKAIYWYWEFNIEQRYFHQFDTLDFKEAMKFYQAEKFTLWTRPDGSRS